VIEKFSISNDKEYYEAWPDVALTKSGKLVCIFSECNHHNDRSYTRIMLTDSEDRGRTWSPKRALSEGLRGEVNKGAPFWNCPRIVTLSDGRLVAVADRIIDNENSIRSAFTWLWTSEDEGNSWEGPVETPVEGIVPDQLIELRNGPNAGRWILTAHSQAPIEGEDATLWSQRCWHSDDCGNTWSGPFVIAQPANLWLCEGSILELPGGELVCFMRENSGLGLDAYKSISRDGGETWDGPYNFPLPGCHRPVAGMLQNGFVMITHRFMQGGMGWLGWWTQNFFAAITPVSACLVTERQKACTRILPLDFDRSPVSDTGYSGWVQFEDGEIYVVNYIVDDAEKAQIRGYSFREEDFVLGQLKY